MCMCSEQLIYFSDVLNHVVKGVAEVFCKLVPCLFLEEGTKVFRV